ncbi:hypothetical protein [Microbacterium sp. NPDC056052]|uniref:hypothetical protein n=1 Tax=Microbacterium sp. NPDC056052 TaxID=3345695 RepID=UPI0035E10F4C
MSSTRNTPGRLITVAVMMGLVAMAGIATAADMGYGAVTASGMAALGAPILLFLGIVALTGGIGCAILIPRILKGKSRGPATTFTALTLLPGLYMFLHALPFLMSGDWSEPLLLILFLLPAPIAIATLVLIWARQTTQAVYQVTSRQQTQVHQ